MIQCDVVCVFHKAGAKYLERHSLNDFILTDVCETNGYRAFSPKVLLFPTTSRIAVKGVRSMHSAMPTSSTFRQSVPGNVLKFYTKYKEIVLILSLICSK